MLLAIKVFSCREVQYRTLIQDGGVQSSTQLAKPIKAAGALMPGALVFEGFSVYPA